MGLVQDTISGFIGGVSQQPDKLTYPNQARSLINMNPDVVSGLSKRKPSEHIAKIAEPLEVAPLIYTVTKEYEKYQVMLDGQGIRVFDLAGEEKEVKVQSTYSYEGSISLQNSFNVLVEMTYTKGNAIDLFTNGKKTSTLYEYYTDLGFNFYSTKELKNKTNYNNATIYSDSDKTTKYIKVAYTADVISLSIPAYTFLLDDGTELYSYSDNIRESTALYKERKRKVVGSTAYWQLSTPYGFIKTKDEDTGNIKLGELDDPIRYITCSRPLKDLSIANIGDYTFITNKNINTELSDETYPNRYPNSALLFVEQGDYSITYNVTINNINVSFTTSGSKKTEISTSYIAGKLASALTSKLDASKWLVTQKNSSILIENVAGESFNIITSDGNGDRNLHSFYKQAESFTDLPLVAPDSFILKITGESGDTSDDYYVQFRTTDDSVFGRGTWRECCSPEVKYHIKPESMPHALVHEKDGSFVLKSIKWTDRQAGDEDTAKTPEFLGNPIQEVFTYKGRLALLSGDKTIYSDTENIFSFFKRTTITKLDTDPIETISNSKMVDLKYALPYNNDLLLFSPTSIFTVSSGDVFSNSTIAMDLTWEYPCSTLCKPIAMGDTCLFAYDNGAYSGLYEIYIASTYSAGVRNITEHITNYIPSNLVKLTAQPQNNIVCALSEKERNSLYVYNYFYNAENKAQSAWHKWTFEGLILGVDFIEQYLYLNIQYDDGVYLERIDISNYQHEEDLEFLFYLDRKTHIYNVEDEDELSLTYDEPSKTTTFEIPYHIQDEKNFMIIDDRGFPLTIKGFDKESNLISISGKYDSITCGFRYYSEWQPIHIYVRQPSQTGGLKLVEGLLMLGDITLNYIDSGYFKVKILPKYTSITPSEYVFTGVVLGTKSALLGKIPTYSDSFLIPIMARNEDIDIVISNDSYLPCCFTSLVWLGDFNIRGK